MSKIHKSCGYEDTGIQILDRILGPDRVAIQQADVTSIAYSIVDTSDGTVVDSGSLTVSAVVFDTLQTDARWTKDATGYNFLWDVAAANFPNGDRIYRLEVAWTPATGEVWHTAYEHTTVGLYLS